MKLLVLTFALVGLVDRSGVPPGRQASCTFPSENRRCPSPRGVWEVEWREPSGKGRHVLWLQATEGGTSKQLLEFDRSADVLWSADGRAFAVTDRSGSSESTLWVFTGPSFLPAVNVEDRLRASLDALPAIFSNGHRYFEAMGWVSADVLRFRVRAYDCEPGKEYQGTFRYQLAGRVSRERSK
jgi:hypothetical protein